MRQLFKRRTRKLPVEVHARRVEFDEADSIQWIIRDITERKELDSLRNDLTAMIYHDLRSPLANIVSSLDVLYSMVPENDRETVEAILKIAENSTDRIQRLVSSLLDVSRLESGQPVADQKVVDTMELIQNAVHDVTPVTGGRHQVLIADLPVQLPPVWVDEDMARRVLDQPHGKCQQVHAHLAAESRLVRREEDDMVHLWVKDNGPGIPAAEQDHIFDKFTRLHGNSRPGGLGIGLAFCRLAVVGHGGRIWVESETGKGAAFHFTFPIATREQLAGEAE